MISAPVRLGKLPFNSSPFLFLFILIFEKVSKISCLSLRVKLNVVFSQSVRGWSRLSPRLRQLRKSPVEQREREREWWGGGGGGGGGRHTSHIGAGAPPAQAQLSLLPEAAEPPAPALGGELLQPGHGNHGDHAGQPEAGESQCTVGDQGVILNIKLKIYGQFRNLESERTA